MSCLVTSKLYLKNRSFFNFIQVCCYFIIIIVIIIVIYLLIFLYKIITSHDLVHNSENC